MNENRAKKKVLNFEKLKWWKQRNEEDNLKREKIQLLTAKQHVNYY